MSISDTEMLRQARTKAATCQAVRSKMRESCRASTNEKEREALALAEQGFGVLQVASWSGVDIAVARALVTGE